MAGSISEKSTARLSRRQRKVPRKGQKKDLEEERILRKESTHFADLARKVGASLAESTDDSAKQAALQVGLLYLFQA